MGGQALGEWEVVEIESVEEGSYKLRRVEEWWIRRTSNLLVTLAEVRSTDAASSPYPSVLILSPSFSLFLTLLLTTCSHQTKERQ